MENNLLAHLLGKHQQYNNVNHLQKHKHLLIRLELLPCLTYQAEQLDKLGMEVIPVELRDAYAFGGGLHCCTADVYREGELKDYFPKQ